MTLSEDEVRAGLAAELSRWTLDDGWICREFRTSGWKATLMVVNAVGHLAEAAWHHPDLAVSYDRVTVRLMTHDVRGVTRKDLELARQIESVIAWRPPAGSALDGTPDDPRLAYLRYD